MRDTAHLSEVEECIYSRCLDQYYSREKPLPSDLQGVCRLVRANNREAKKAVSTVLGEFFTLEADGYHQKRCDAELAKYAEKSAKAAQSAAARWKQTDSERNANAYANAPPNAKRTQSEGNASQEPITSNQEPKKKEQSASQGSRLPADWVLSEEWRAEAQSLRADWSPENIVFVAEKFRDYWHGKPGKEGRKVDWLATWRNWCRQEKTQGTKRRETLAELLEREAQEAAHAGE